MTRSKLFVLVSDRIPGPGFVVVALVAAADQHLTMLARLQQHYLLPNRS